MYVQGSHEEHVSKHCQVSVYTISRCPCVCKVVLMTHTPHKDTQCQHKAVLSDSVHNICKVDIRVSRQMVMWTNMHYDHEYGTGAMVALITGPKQRT